MATKIGSLPTKVAIYYAILRGEGALAVAKKYGISEPSAKKYANEAIEALRSRPDIAAVPLLNAFLKENLRFQTFSFEPALDQHIYPVLRSYLEQAAAQGMKAKGGADYMLSARVTEATHNDFHQIVKLLEKERPDITAAGHLRDVIDAYVAKGIVPSPEVRIEQSPRLMEELTKEIVVVLRRNGVQV